MRALTIVAIAVVLLGFAAAPAVAQGGGAACGSAGTWKGATGDIEFLSTYADTQGSVAGTVVLSFWGDPTLGGAFPMVTQLTNGHGTWSKVSGDVFDYQFLAVGQAANGSAVYLMKVTGTKTLVSCNVQTFSVNISIYAPTQDPFGDGTPLVGPFPGAPGRAVRIPYPR